MAESCLICLCMVQSNCAFGEYGQQSGAQMSDVDHKRSVSRLLELRIALLKGPLHNEQANMLIATLLYLQDKDPTKPLTLVIDSPGGLVDPGFASVELAVDFVNGRSMDATQAVAYGLADRVANLPNH